MLSAIMTPAVWRFHRATGFRYAGAPEFLTAQGGRVNSAIVRALVKALGFKRTVALLAGLAVDFLDDMVWTFFRSEPATFEKPLTHAFGRAVARIDALGPSDAVQKELLVVAFWLNSEGISSGFPRSNSSWESLVRRADDAADSFNWLREDAPTAWQPPLPRLCIGRIQFEAIATLESLEEEGKLMDHCVAMLHSDCASGESVVFRVSGSLPNGRHARATAQFTRHATKGWVLEQIKGRKNIEAPRSLEKAARAVALQFNEGAIVMLPPVGPTACDASRGAG